MKNEQPDGFRAHHYEIDNGLKTRADLSVYTADEVKDMIIKSMKPSGLIPSILSIGADCLDIGLPVPYASHRILLEVYEAESDNSKYEMFISERSEKCSGSVTTIVNAVVMHLLSEYALPRIERSVIDAHNILPRERKFTFGSP